VSELRPTAVNRILSEVRAAQAQGKVLVSLMRGEPDFHTPAHIVEAAAAAARAGRTAYPNNQGEPSLRQAVAQALLAGTGQDYDPEQEILITTGATLGIYCALCAVLDCGDEILVPSPIYDAYQSPIALVGGVARAVPAEIRGTRFRLDAARLAGACGPRTRAILLNTPWNPTGTVFTREEVAAIVKVAEEHHLWIISDEIYEAIVFGEARHFSPAGVSPGGRSRTLVVNSFSKTYAMTGWRLGYIAGPAAAVRAAYLVLQQVSRGPATFVQDAGVTALEGPQDCVTEMRCEYARRRAQVLEALAGIDGVRVLAPEGGFFAMLDIRELGRPSDEVRRTLLHEAGVVAVHGSAYGSSGEGTLRVSFATGGDNLQKGLDALRTGLIGIGTTR
jgi:aspartate/methionine/tyrosine aminotransferase